MFIRVTQEDGTMFGTSWGRIPNATEDDVETLRRKFGKLFSKGLRFFEREYQEDGEDVVEFRIGGRPGGR